MPELLRKKIDYSVVCINEFARKKQYGKKRHFYICIDIVELHFLTRTMK